MGTIISLDLASLELASSKNSRGIDHGALFQAADRKPYRTSTSIAPVSEEEEPLGASDMAFVRTLKDVVPRLELLGYTLANARADYDRWVATWLEDREALRDDLDLPTVTPLTFAEFRDFVVRHAVTDLDDTYMRFETDDARLKGRFIAEADTGPPLRAPAAPPAARRRVPPCSAPLVVGSRRLLAAFSFSATLARGQDLGLRPRRTSERLPPSFGLGKDRPGRRT